MAEYRFAGTDVKIGANVVAKVTSLRYQLDMQEVDVTGAEDVSGALSSEKFLTVAIGRTLELEGVSDAGTGASGTPQYSAGQEALFDAAEAGTQVTISVRKPIIGAGVAKGWDFVGYFTSIQETGSVKDAYKWSGTFRVNSKSEVLT